MDLITQVRISHRLARGALGATSVLNNKSKFSIPVHLETKILRKKFWVFKRLLQTGEEELDSLEKMVSRRYF